MATAAVVAPGTGTQLVLARLTKPYDPVRAVTALLGLPQRAARHLVGAALATSVEAEVLLDAMPKIVRSLAIATSDKAERCYGELRGAVLWSETMSARSASAGDPGLFVCSTTTKAYDTVENRVLKAALAAIERAGADATHGLDPQADDSLRRARHNEHRARHLLEHQTLSAVPITRISGRALRRTRTGGRRRTYEPAVAVLRRAQEPCTLSHLQERRSDAVAADHDLLAATLLALDSRTGARSTLRSSHGGLVAGPVRYDHLAGVTVDGVRITGPHEIASVLAGSAP
jgi:hypothetical protein